MLNKQLTVLPTAAHVTKLMLKQESTLKELDISALKEISQSLKILSSTNLLTPEKPPLDRHSRPLTVSSPTLVLMILETSVLKVSMLAHKMELALDQDIQTVAMVVPKVDDEPFFLIASILYFLINIPRNYSLYCLKLYLSKCII